MELESDKAKSVGNSNLLPIQHLLVRGHFNAAEGPIVNDHQIQGREILRWIAFASVNIIETKAPA
jgi:hypothetical protein